MDSCGFDLLGAETIPTAGANYTDAKTVAEVQSELILRGEQGMLHNDLVAWSRLGEPYPTIDGADLGILGPKTKAAIKKLQAALGYEQTGKIDEHVLLALNVTPGVTTPGRATVQAQVVRNTEAAANHAVTGRERTNWLERPVVGKLPGWGVLAVGAVMLAAIGFLFKKRA